MKTYFVICWVGRFNKENVVSEEISEDLIIDLEDFIVDYLSEFGHKPSESRLSQEFNMSCTSVKSILECY